MTDIASLGFSIDSTGTDRAKQSLDNMAQSSKNAADAAAILIKAQQAQIDQLSQLVQMQAQVSQGHSNISSTIMPLAGALAIGAGSFVAANYAMSQFTDMVQSRVSSAIDGLNQRLYTSFSLMGALGLNNSNMSGTFISGQLNRQVTGVSPLFSLQSQYAGAIMGVSAQTGYNTGMAFNDPYNLQMQNMMRSYGINPLDSSPQNQQALVQAMLNARPSATRTADFAAIGYNGADIQSAYIQQQVKNARTPYEVFLDNQQQSQSQQLLAAANNGANWDIANQKMYAAARALLSATSNAEIAWYKDLNSGSWADRFLDVGPREDTRRKVAFDDINGYTGHLQARGAYAYQDLWNHITGNPTTQGWGTDFTQTVVGLTAPIAGGLNKDAVTFGFNAASQYYTQAPNQQQTFSNTELDNAASQLAQALGQIAPAASQISNIRSGWETLNSLFGGDQSKGGSLVDMLQGYTNSSGQFQPGLKQEVQGLPGGADLYSALSGIITTQVQDLKNQNNNPLTYQNTVANQANMAVAMSGSEAQAGLLQAQYGALQRLGVDPTPANLAALQNNPAFQSNMQGYYQQPYITAGQQNQASNLTIAQLGILGTINPNDRSMYSGVVGQLTAPGTLGNIAVSQGQTNSAPADVLAYIAKQGATKGLSAKAITQLQAMADVEGGGYDVHSTINGITGVGPGQLTYNPSDPKNTAWLKSLGVNNIDDWHQNANGMINYFSQLLGLKGGDINAATMAYNGSGPSAFAYLNKVNSFSGLSQVPGAAGLITAANASALQSAQTQQALSAIGDTGLYAAGQIFSSNDPYAGYSAQQALLQSQVAQMPTVQQGPALATGLAQIQAQAAYRFGAIQNQAVVGQAQTGFVTKAAFNTGLSPLDYNNQMMIAQANAAAAPIASYMGPTYGPMIAPMMLAQAASQAQGQAAAQQAQTVNQSGILFQQSLAGPTQLSQDQAAFVATIANNPAIGLDQKNVMIQSYIKNQNQGAINSGQNQIATANLNNSALIAQSNISPWLSPTQQAMQLGQIQITQAQAQAYGLVGVNGQMTPFNQWTPQQQSQTNTLISANNQNITAQQAISQQQQVTSDIQGMSDTVVTALEKLATGGYNAGYILKAAASNIAGLGAQALVFQPLQNTISQGFGDLAASFLPGGSGATPITNGGVFGAIANSLFNLGGNTGGHAGASVSSGGGSFLGGLLGAIGSLFTGGAASGLISGGDFGYAGAGGSFSAASLAAHQGLAKGGVFNNGSIMPFAYGDIINSPTNFPMAGGLTGLMGEAGPEAIVPLQRTADGKLGIASNGSTSQSGPNITIHAPITVGGGQSGKMTAAQQADLQSQFTQTLYTSVKSIIVNEMRNGGTISQYGAGR